MRLFIVGYMCSGKTTLAKFLADRLAYSFVDLDAFIEHKEKMSVTDIFNDKGEDVFRQMEHDYLNDLCQMKDVVIATGGGTPCSNNNMALINSCGVSIYLQTSPDVLIDRLLVMGENRPLVAGKTRAELEGFVSTHLEERDKYYQKASMSLNGDVWDVDRLASELISQLEEII